MVDKLKELLISSWGITAEEAQRIVHLFEFQELPKGTFHTKIGDRHPNLSIVMDGFLRVYAIAENKESTQWISSPSELITDLSGFVFHQPARWNIQCLTNVTVFTITQQRYESLSQLIENWAEIEK